MSEQGAVVHDERPLTPEQARMWLVDRLLPASEATEAPISVLIRGPLSVAALDTALAGVYNAHESLRGRFPVRGGVPCWMVTQATEHHVRLLDLSALPPGRRETTCAAVLSSMSTRPFDLENGPLWRPALVRLARDEHALIIGVHHLLVDLWSVSLIVDELSVRYARAVGGTTPPQVVPAPGRRPLNLARVRRDLDYWREQLAGLTCAPLPLDRPRPALPALTSRVLGFDLSVELSAGLRAMSTGHGVTLYVTLLAALQALVHCWCGHQDHTTVSVSAGRRGRAEERVVGLLTEILVLRGSTAGDPRFSDLLGQVRETVLDALDHSRVTFADIVAMVDPGRELEPSPLRQIGFSLHNLPPTGPPPAGLLLEPLPAPVSLRGDSEADLWLEVFDDGSGPLRVRLQMDDRFFEERTLRSTAQRWEALLQAVTEDPDSRLSELKLLNPPELDAGTKSNGVDDRRELPSANREGLDDVIGDDQQREDVAAVAAIVHSLLDCGPVHPGSNFFRLGGDSMDAVRLTSLLHDRFGAEVSLYELMTARTIAAIAERARRSRSLMGGKS